MALYRNDTPLGNPEVWLPNCWFRGRSHHFLWIPREDKICRVPLYGDALWERHTRLSKNNLFRFLLDNSAEPFVVAEKQQQRTNVVQLSKISARVIQANAWETTGRLKLAGGNGKHHVVINAKPMKCARLVPGRAAGSSDVVSPSGGGREWD